MDTSGKKIELYNYLQVIESSNQAVSCGRDKVVILWSLETGDKLKTVPVLESVEGMCLVSQDTLQVVC